MKGGAKNSFGLRRVNEDPKHISPLGDYISIPVAADILGTWSPSGHDRIKLVEKWMSNMSCN